MSRSEKLTFEEADARFHFSRFLPAYDERQDVIMLSPGAYEAADLDLEERSYVVDGDLIIQGTVRSWEEGRFLVVLGDLTLESLLISGPMIHVQGALHARHAILTDYNHGVLSVGGDVAARVIVAEHHFLVGGDICCEAAIDLGGFAVSSPSFSPTISRQRAIHAGREVFIPAVLNEQGFIDGAALADHLADGGFPLKENSGDDVGG